MEDEYGTFEAKNRLSELLDRVEEGRRVYISRRGRRIAVLSPVEPQGEAGPRFGSARGMISLADDFDAPLDDFAEYSG